MRVCPERDGQARVRISCAMLSSTVNSVSPTRKINAGVRCESVTMLPDTTPNAPRRSSREARCVAIVTTSTDCPGASSLKRFNPPGAGRDAGAFPLNSRRNQPAATDLRSSTL